LIEEKDFRIFSFKEDDLAGEVKIDSILTHQKCKMIQISAKFSYFNKMLEVAVT